MFRIKAVLPTTVCLAASCAAGSVSSSNNTALLTAESVEARSEPTLTDITATLPARRSPTVRVGTGNPNPVRTSQVSLPPVESLFVATGPPEADTVAVFVQGGPFPDLRPQLLDRLPGMSKRLRVTVHQPWTLDRSLLENPESVSQERASQLNGDALEMLDRVVRYFMPTKTVCVVGHSFGALLTLLWVATHERPVSVQILAGRLALPEIVWRGFQAGHLYWFPDAVTPQPIDGPTPESRIVAMRLQSDLGRRRFAELLQTTDLSRMSFVFGEHDRLVGTLSSDEVAFLKARDATPVALPGDHRSMFEAENAPAMAEVWRC